MKAIIDQVSSVDATNTFAVLYSLVDDDGAVKYDNLVARGGSKAEIKETISAKIASLQAAIDEANTIQPGEEISL